jgi:hypothetical protein
VFGAYFIYTVPLETITIKGLRYFYYKLHINLGPYSLLIQNYHQAVNLRGMSKEDLMFVIGLLQKRGAPPFPHHEIAWGNVSPYIERERSVPPFDIVILPSAIEGAGLGAFAWKPLLSLYTILGKYEGEKITEYSEMTRRSNSTEELEVLRDEYRDKYEDPDNEGVIARAFYLYPEVGDDNPYIFRNNHNDSSSDENDPEYDFIIFSHAIDASARIGRHRGSWVRYVNNANHPRDVNCRFTIFVGDTADIHGTPRTLKKDDVYLDQVSRIPQGHELLTEYVDV